MINIKTKGSKPSAEDGNPQGDKDGNNNPKEKDGNQPKDEDGAPQNKGQGEENKINKMMLKGMLMNIH